MKKQNMKANRCPLTGRFTKKAPAPCVADMVAAHNFSVRRRKAGPISRLAIEGRWPGWKVALAGLIGAAALAAALAGAITLAGAVMVALLGGEVRW